MDINNEIKDLIEIVDRSSFTVLALKKGDMELVLKKALNEEKNVNPSQIFPEATVSAQDTTISSESTVSVQDPTTNDNVAELQQEKTSNQKPQQDTNTTSIVAPLVGVFYQSSSPEAEAFVTVGQKVKEGDVVCIIEAMKILNEIKAPVSGTITKIHVKNDDIVEFNQVLMEVGE